MSELTGNPGKKRQAILAGQLLLILLILAITEYLCDSGIVPDLYLAAPTRVLSDLVALIRESSLLRHFGVTLLEFLAGLLLAGAVGIGTGILIARSEFADRLLRPYLAALMSIPMVAIIPLITIWLGIGFLSKIVFVFLFGVFNIIYNTSAGIRETSENYIKVARVFGSTKPQLTVRVLLPSAIPMIVTGFRLASAHGLIGVLFGEMLASEAGLGFLMKKSSATYQMGEVIALALIVTLLAVLIIKGIDLFERNVLLRWKYE